MKHHKTFPDGTSEKVAIDANTNIPEVIQEFSGQFKSEKNDFKFINNGLFDIFLMTLFGILKSDHC
jgi:anthranilate synthase component 1